MPNTREVVTIDLKETSFTPGKKQYEKIKQRLTDNFTEKFNVILAWEPSEEKLCPSSIAVWFHNRGYKAFLCQQRTTERINCSLSIPTIESNYDVNKVIEWIGIFCINGDIKNESEDNFVNTYTCPSPKMPVEQILYAEYTGFFTRSRVKKIFDTLVYFIKSNQTTSATIPWRTIHIHGFADSPVSWGLKEHTFLMDGDNSYTVIYKPTGDFIVHKSLSSNNKPRIFQ